MAWHCYIMFLVYDIVQIYTHTHTYISFSFFSSSPKFVISCYICYRYSLPLHLLSFSLSYIYTPPTIDIYITTVHHCRWLRPPVCIRWYNCTFSNLSTLSNQWHLWLSLGHLQSCLLRAGIMSDAILLTLLLSLRLPLSQLDISCLETLEYVEISD